MIETSSSEKNFFTDEFRTVGKSRVAIVVDPNHIVRKNNRLILERMSFEVKEVSDATNVLKSLKKYGNEFCSLIVTEMVLPGMNGADFIATMRNEYPKSDIRIVACSCIQEISLIKQIIDLGIDGYIMKPVNTKTFAEKIREVFLMKDEKKL